MARPEIVALQRVEELILFIRGQKVILDSDLATLYGVETKALGQAVRRNLQRFPEDFMFQLTLEETRGLRSQFVTSNAEVPDKRELSASPGDMQGPRPTSQIQTGTRGGRRYLPYAFTEQGVAMLSSVLRSSRAVFVNIEIMRAFVRLRQMLQANSELAARLDALEKKYDAQFRVVFEAIRELMAPEANPARRIGFRSEDR